MKKLNKYIQSEFILNRNSSSHEVSNCRTSRKRLNASLKELTAELLHLYPSDVIKVFSSWRRLACIALWMIIIGRSEVVASETGSELCQICTMELFWGDYCNFVVKITKLRGKLDRSHWRPSPLPPKKNNNNNNTSSKQHRPPQGND